MHVCKMCNNNMNKRMKHYTIINYNRSTYMVQVKNNKIVLCTVVTYVSKNNNPVNREEGLDEEKRGRHHHVCSLLLF